MTSCYQSFRHNVISSMLVNWPMAFKFVHTLVTTYVSSLRPTLGFVPSLQQSAIRNYLERKKREIRLVIPASYFCRQDFRAVENRGHDQVLFILYYPSPQATSVPAGKIRLPKYSPFTLHYHLPGAGGGRAATCLVYPTQCIICPASLSILPCNFGLLLGRIALLLCPFLHALLGHLACL